MSGNILVIEDELLMRRLLQQVLEKEGFTVAAVGTVGAGLAEVTRRVYDLVLLDVILPDGDGFTCCREIRTRHKMPIVMVSTRAELADRVTGLEIGADDYIVKPFAPQEVVARVRAQLRRAKQVTSDEDDEDTIRLGRLVIDPLLQDVIIDGSPAGLTQKEFRLMKLLGARAGRAVSRDYLIDHVWGRDELSSDKSLAVYIRRLRQKVEPSADEPRIVVTVRGFGYKVVPLTT